MSTRSPPLSHPARAVSHLTIAPFPDAHIVYLTSTAPNPPVQSGTLFLTCHSFFPPLSLSCKAVDNPPPCLPRASSASQGTGDPCVPRSMTYRSFNLTKVQGDILVIKRGSPTDIDVPLPLRSPPRVTHPPNLAVMGVKHGGNSSARGHGPFWVGTADLPQDPTSSATSDKPAVATKAERERGVGEERSLRGSFFTSLARRRWQ